MPSNERDAAPARTARVLSKDYRARAHHRCSTSSHTADATPQNLVEDLYLGRGCRGSLIQLRDHRCHVEVVDGLDLDQQVVTDERRLAHGGGEARQFGEADVGDHEQPLVGTGLLDYFSAAD